MGIVVARRVVLALVVLLNVVVLGALATGRLLPSISTDRPFSLRTASPVLASSQDDTLGTALLVDDAMTANPALQLTPLEAPSGFSDPGRTINLPEGFSASLLASGLSRPRFMTFDAEGNLLVAAGGGGAVLRFPAAGGTVTPMASLPAPIVGDLNAPTSLAIDNGYLYVGETNQISRYRYDPTGDLGSGTVVVPNLPVGGHSTRTVAFAPDGSLFVSVGSSCNICAERDQRRAAIVRYESDGINGEIFAWGLRNAVGLAFHPVTGRLWATVNERDNQGNEIPPDLVTIVGAGQNFGWPDCQPPNAKPQTPDANCTRITPPTVGIQAHSAPLGLAFLVGSGFPADYQGDLIVAQHGSWNRETPAEPKLLRIHFENGRPVSAVDFATGWQAPSGNRWGRPAGVIVAPDGSLIVSDDQAGFLYRIAYTG
jgi:glucose/arabinose dehydrogenase